MFRLEGGRPGDARGFLHKSFIGRAVGGVVGGVFKRTIGATPIGQALGIAGSIFKRPARPVAPRTTTARPTMRGQQGKELGRELKLGGVIPGGGFAGTALTRTIGLGGGVGGIPSLTPDCRAGESAICCKLRNGSTAEQAAWQQFCGTAGEQQRPVGGPVGDAVMGQFGAALQPGTMMIERSVCLPGMQLAKDGLCYNKGAITNSQRMWPRGRRPLLTGGDMRAIGIAARAGAKLDRTTKRLRALGMMKKLPAGRSRAHAHAKPVAAISVHE